VFSLRSKVVVGSVALSFLAAVCGTSGTADASPTATSSSVSLAGVCPSTVVVQTDWDPEADHFAAYELAAPNGTVDTNKKTYTAELLAHGGKATGVKIQIRTGGPAIGNQLVSAQLYEDSSILLGYVETDEAIELSATQPTVAVVADRQVAPTVIVWSPSKHPGVHTIAQLGKTNTTVLYYNGAPYMDYLTGAGILKKSQVDAAYNGTPAQSIASGGADALQGFATAEPYEYAHEISQWDKPMTYQLVNSYGYDPYPSLATRPQNITKYAACFKKLVPIIQQGIVDYAANPGPADALIVKLVKEYNNGWSYDAGEAAYAAHAQVADGLIADSSNGQIGNFNDSRIQKFINLAAPIYKSDGKTIKAGLTPQEITTNQFIDPAIHLPKSGS
jgi:hypothetical protein